MIWYILVRYGHTRGFGQVLPHEHCYFSSFNTAYSTDIQWLSISLHVWSKILALDFPSKDRKTIRSSVAIKMMKLAYKPTMAFTPVIYISLYNIPFLGIGIAWELNPRVPSSILGLGYCLSEFLMFSSYLQLPPISQKHAQRWIGYAKLLVGVNECTCMAPCNGLVSHL